MEQDPVAADSETPTRVEDLWFPKDTIVIRAENKIFQVSRAVLAARSIVFRDMFAFPQPTTENTEQFDGSPVVRLHDPARDVEVFLRAIYDSSYFMPAPVAINLWVVLAILRLSNKYDIQYLYRRALDHLADDGWYAASYAECQWGNHLDVIHKNSPFNALSVITTAIEVGATWLLPRAYYCASTFYPSQLLPFMEGNMKEHVRICLIAHVQLLRGTVSVNSFLTMRYLSCATPHVCDTIRDAHYLDFLADVDAGRDLNTLSRWNNDDWEGFEAVGMCDACRQSAKTRRFDLLG